MPIAEDKALEILSELIKKPDTRAEELPRIWGELLNAYNQHFFLPVAEPKKKRKRKRAAGANPNLGWPAGVSRAEYKAWKDEQEFLGKTENLNPQEYKRQRDAGASKPALSLVAEAVTVPAKTLTKAAKPAVEVTKKPGRPSTKATK